MSKKIQLLISILVLTIVTIASKNIKANDTSHQNEQFLIHFMPTKSKINFKPIDIAKGDKGSYWIISSEDCNNIWELDETGKPIKKVNLGKVYPSSIWIQSEKIFLTDPINSQLIILNLDGNILQKINLTATNRIIKPVYITGDYKSKLFVADIFFHQLIILDMSGNFIKAIGLPGHDSGQFYYPYGIAYSDSQKFFYISDFGNEEVDIYSIDGKWIGQVKALQGRQIRGLAWDERKRQLYAVDIFNHKVCILDSKLNIIKEIAEVTPGEYFNYPNSVRIYNKEILITDRENNRIVQRIEVDN